jgi:hypothetical protein
MIPQCLARKLSKDRYPTTTSNFEQHPVIFQYKTAYASDVTRKTEENTKYFVKTGINLFSESFILKSAPKPVITLPIEQASCPLLRKESAYFLQESDKDGY